MNPRLLISATMLCTMATYFSASAQEDVTIVAPTSEAAEGLDLKAVSELFKAAENLEEFEKSLNDPDLGVNNLDLDDNGDVDFLRVVEDVAEDTHVIILQAILGEDEFQDVATIEVEKTEDDSYNMQVRGNQVIYGVDYYYAPTHVHIHTWPVIAWIYRPVYRPYRSVFYFGYYPRWWRPYRSVTINVYRTRTVKFTRRTTFAFSNTTRVRTVNRVTYKPRTSTLVRKKTVATKTPAGTTKAKKVSRTTTRGGKASTAKTATVRKTNKKTGQATVKKGVKKTTKTKGGKKTTVKKGTKKTKVKKKS